VWRDGVAAEAFGGSLLGRVRTLARSGTHLHPNEPLRQLLEALPVKRIEELALPFQCVAASIERAAAHWFTDGPIVPAVLASSAVILACLRPAPPPAASQARPGNHPG
jgi:NTE family protein